MQTRRRRAAWRSSALLFGLTIGWALPGLAEDRVPLGEISILDTAPEERQKDGHVSLGPLDPLARGLVSAKGWLRDATGIDLVLESAPIFQWDLVHDGGYHANLETNLIARAALVDREDPDRGSLIAWYQWAHTLGDQNTSDFQSRLGILSPVNGGDTAPSSRRSLFQHLAWDQRFLDGRLRLMIGKQTTRVSLDLNRYAVSDREDFFSPMIVNNPVVPYTARLGLGVLAGYDADAWRTSVLIRDADGIDKVVDWSVDANELEYVWEFALTPGDLAGLGEGNYRFTLHYTDSVGQMPSGFDVSLSFDQDVHEEWGLFLRWAWSSEDFRSFVQRAAFGTQIKQPLGFANDRVGIGFWWGDPADGSLDDEFGAEIFWKLQLTPFLEITPDLQLVIEPALDPGRGAALIGGIRVRALF